MAYEINPKIYSDWLQTLEWTYFFTGTFADEGYTINGSRRAAMRFFQHYDHKPEFAFVCIEAGNLYGRIHIHALLRYPDKGLWHAAEPIWFDWFNRYGFAKVEVPKSSADVAAYCSKYVTKHMADETYFFLPSES